MNVFQHKTSRGKMLDISLKRKKKMIINHTCVRLSSSSRGCEVLETARICCYKDSCLLTRKGRPVIRTIKSCDWSPKAAKRSECNRLDGPLLANTEDGMWVCVRKKKKRRWDRESERGREGERTCLIGKMGGHVVFFFFFQERDDRWKERLRREKVGKRRLKGLTSRGREDRTSRNERDQRQRPH